MKNGDELPPDTVNTERSSLKRKLEGSDYDPIPHHYTPSFYSIPGSSSIPYYLSVSANAMCMLPPYYPAAMETLGSYPWYGIGHPASSNTALDLSGSRRIDKSPVDLKAKDCDPLHSLSTFVSRSIANPEVKIPPKEPVKLKGSASIDTGKGTLISQYMSTQAYKPIEAFKDSLSETFLDIEKRLSDSLVEIPFQQPVCHIYNPIEYAQEPHRMFVNKYCQTEKSVLFLGMNPGPFGMSQTGVPFGEVSVVKNWLGISGYVSKPATEHPKRPIHGFSCARSEVSGSRFWGFLQRVCVKPENFFRYCHVHNYCPLAFLSTTGKNVTPAQMSKFDLRLLNDSCDEALRDIVRLLNVKIVVGVGKFPEDRARKALVDKGFDVRVVTLMHPSPINPMANKRWEETAEKQLTECGVMEYLTKG